jgi:rubrerythrin
MDIPRFLDLAVELEAQISELYEQIADLSCDPPIAARLKAIASEELNHANALRRGKRYYEGYPDLFAGLTMDENEAWMGVEEVKIFRALLSRTKVPLVDSIKRLLEFEKRFEKVHVGASVKTADPTLKKLFTGLTKGDQSHIAILKVLIESLG